MRTETAYSYFEVHHFLGKSRHLIVEAEAVFSHCVCREHIVCLTLFGSIEYYSVVWPNHAVVDIEGSARLNLGMTMLADKSISTLLLQRRVEQ